MNDNGDRGIGDIVLDRLVDGELSEEEYREAIRNLEEQPDGWRRCAVAFLEAQAWGREFAALREESPVAPAVESPRNWKWLYLGAMAAACAASFLLAFGIALQLQREPSGTPQRGLLVRDENAADPADRAPGSLVVDSPKEKFLPWESPDVSEPLSHDPVARYQLVVGDGVGTPQTVEMPVFAADDPRVDVLLDEYASMPREIIQALQEDGNEVQRRRNWLPIRSSSGARFYVPVDELHVTPVSARSFQ